MKRREFLKGVGATALLPAALSHATDGKRTNVILIMSDDTGYEVFGCYGSKQYRTPRIDQLAETGMRFNHCYSQPVCWSKPRQNPDREIQCPQLYLLGHNGPEGEDHRTHDEGRRLCHLRGRKVATVRSRNFRARVKGNGRTSRGCGL